MNDLKHKTANQIISAVRYLETEAKRNKLDKVSAILKTCADEMEKLVGSK